MSYTLLEPDVYIERLVADVTRATRRINIISLVFSEDDRTRALIDALVAAAERGVPVSIGLDFYFSYRELGMHTSRWDYLRYKQRQMRTTKRRLQAAGAKVRWLSQFGIVIFARRTHIKWSIVDNTVYSFGGINLYDGGLLNADYTFRVVDEILADQLSDEHQRVISTDTAGIGYRSHTIDHNGQLILIDGGKIFDSIIEDHVLSYAKKARHIVYVSQYSPSGQLARIIKRTPSEVYFNQWQHAHDTMTRLFLRFSLRFTGVPSAYDRSKYLHAKCVIFTLPGNKKIAITGSHNFHHLGSILGTREVALETRDPAIIAQLERFIADELTSV